MGVCPKIWTYWWGIIHLLAIKSNSLGKVKITLNGKETHVLADSIEQLLKLNQLNPELIIVEHNNIILNKNTYKTTSLAPNDTIEIIRYIGGGKKM